ncbi:MAG: hypothetical protein ACRELX_10345 [Longimicrobiales bacterium]
MTRGAERARVAAAQAALRDAGIVATIEVGGFARDIAIVHAQDAGAIELAASASLIKAAGFRYVAIDLDAPTVDA